MILQQAAKGRVGRDSGRGEARRALLVEGGLPPKQLRLNQRRFANTKCSRIVLADLVRLCGILPSPSLLRAPSASSLLGRLPPSAIGATAEIVAAGGQHNPNPGARWRGSVRRGEREGPPERLHGILGYAARHDCKPIVALRDPRKRRDCALAAGGVPCARRAVRADRSRRRSLVAAAQRAAGARQAGRSGEAHGHALSAPGLGGQRADAARARRRRIAARAQARCASSCATRDRGIDSAHDEPLRAGRARPGRRRPTSIRPTRPRPRSRRG